MAARRACVVVSVLLVGGLAVPVAAGGPSRAAPVDVFAAAPAVATGDTLSRATVRDALLGTRESLQPAARLAATVAALSAAGEAEAVAVGDGEYLSQVGDAGRRPER
jgi:hypothetical protein